VLSEAEAKAKNAERVSRIDTFKPTQLYAFFVPRLPERRIGALGLGNGAKSIP
jgi:hypothetical protein